MILNFFVVLAYFCSNEVKVFGSGNHHKSGIKLAITYLSLKIYEYHLLLAFLELGCLLWCLKFVSLDTVLCRKMCMSS